MLASDFKTYFQERVQFLNEFSWIFIEDNVRYIKHDILGKLPQEWIETFDQMNYGSDFSELPFNAIQVRYLSLTSSYLSLPDMYPKITLIFLGTLA